MTLSDDARGLRSDIAALTDAVAGLRVDSTSDRASANKYRHIVVGLVVSLLIDVSLTALLGVTNYRINSYVACQARYSDAVSVRLLAVSAVGVKERTAERVRGDALDNLLIAPALLVPASERTPAQDAQTKALYAGYVAAARAVAVVHRAGDAVRESHPVLAEASKTCH